MLDTRYITYVKVRIQSAGLLRIGTGEDDILIDHQTGHVVIPATSIAGAMKEYFVNNVEDAETISELFGNKETKKKSRLFIQDAVCDTPFSVDLLERRERVSIDHELGVAKEEDGGKFNVTGLGKGLCFTLQFCMELVEGDAKEYHVLLYQGICAIHNRLIQFGAQKTNGAGIFDVLSVDECKLDLKKKVEYRKYLLSGLNHTENLKFENITDSVLNKKLRSNVMRISATVICDSPILSAGVPDISDMADKEPVKDRKGDYIIPGSSIKGILRNQCERIAGYLDIPDKDKEITLLFGEKGDVSAQGKRGNVYVQDSTLKRSRLDLVKYHRIKIDKFTGGTVRGAKFDYRPVKSQFNLEIILHKSDGDAGLTAVAILLYAIRDLLQGRVSIGGNSNIGFGYLTSKKIKLYDNGVQYSINLENGGNPDKLSDYFKACARMGGLSHE